jgi:CRISPR/Cas system-associated exonuclease Cas4 (RecB family)
MNTIKETEESKAFRERRMRRMNEGYTIKEIIHRHLSDAVDELNFNPRVLGYSAEKRLLIIKFFMDKFPDLDTRIKPKEQADITYEFLRSIKK